MTEPDEQDGLTDPPELTFEEWRQIMSHTHA